MSSSPLGRTFFEGIAQALVAFAEAVQRKVREQDRPPFPLGFEGLYEDYVNLAATRDVSMAVGPITYLEIYAYQATTHASLTAWEVATIRRIDTAIRAILVATSGTSGEAQPIPITDAASLKAKLRGMSGKKPSKTSAPS